MENLRKKIKMGVNFVFRIFYVGEVALNVVLCLPHFGVFIAVFLFWYLVLFALLSFSNARASRGLYSLITHTINCFLCKYSLSFICFKGAVNVTE